MDLKNFDISNGEAGIELTILDLDNKPTDIKIKLLCLHGKKGRAALINSVKNDKADTAHILAALTTGWSGLTEGGKELKFNPEAAEKLYGDYPIIAAQVEKFVEDARNFLKK